MFVLDAVIALIAAAAFVLLLTSLFGTRSPWAEPWALFVVFFLFIWAGGIWLTPIGPPFYNVYWIPFLLIGLLLMLFIAAAIGPTPPPRTRREAIDQAQPDTEVVAVVGLSIFFWLLVGMLVALILSRYFFRV